MPRVLCLLFLFSSIIYLKAAQNDTVKTNIIFPEFRFHYGFIIRHHNDIAHLTNSHFPAYEFNIVKQTSGNKLWQQIYAYPQIGISFLYSTLGNNPYVGNAYSLTPYINFPLYQTSHFRFCYRFGTGLSWLTKKFDVNTDYKNIAISSNVNASIRTDFEADWYINSSKSKVQSSKFNNNSNFIISTGIGLSHYSNGGFKQPNLGLNVATLSVGIAYQLTTQNSKVKSQKSKLLTSNFQHPTSCIQLIVYAGSKGIFPPESKNYAVYEIDGEYLKRISYKSEIGGGVNLVYDFSLPALQKQFGDTITQGLKVFQPGVFIAYQLDISKLKLQFNLGSYLYSAYKQNGSVFDRLILSYPLSEKMFMNLSLKSYYFKADVTEIGIGYKLN